MSNFVETKRLIKELESLGCTVVLGKRAHYKVYHPDGHFMTTISGTPKNIGHAIKNARRQLRQLGLEIKP